MQDEIIGLFRSSIGVSFKVSGRYSGYRCRYLESSDRSREMVVSKQRYVFSEIIISKRVQRHSATLFFSHLLLLTAVERQKTQDQATSLNRRVNLDAAKLPL